MLEDDVPSACPSLSLFFPLSLYLSPSISPPLSFSLYLSLSRAVLLVTLIPTPCKQSILSIMLKAFLFYQRCLVLTMNSATHPWIMSHDAEGVSTLPQQLAQYKAVSLADPNHPTYNVYTGGEVAELASFLGAFDAVGYAPPSSNQPP